jgi:hypothetical protein
VGTEYGADPAKGYDCKAADYSDCGVRTYNLNAGPVGTRVHSWFGYLQDDWQPVPQLTLNLGVRVEVEQGINDIGKPPTTKDPLDFGTDTESPYEGVLPARLGTAPRFGISVDPWNNGKTRFFGTYGWYYDLAGGDFWDWANTRTAAGYVREVRDANGNFQWSNSQDPEGSPVDYDRYLQVPRMEKVLVGAEREVARDFSVSVRGILSRTQGLTEDVNVDGNNWIVTNPTVKYRMYRGLEVAAEKKFSDNWQLLASYTLSESYGTSPGQFELAANAESGSNANNIACCLLLAACCSLLLLAACCSLLLLLAACCLLLAARCSLLAARCSLLAACCLLLAGLVPGAIADVVALGVVALAGHPGEDAALESEVDPDEGDPAVGDVVLLIREWPGEEVLGVATDEHLEHHGAELLELVEGGEEGLGIRAGGELVVEVAEAHGAAVDLGGEEVSGALALAVLGAGVDEGGLGGVGEGELGSLDEALEEALIATEVAVDEVGLGRDGADGVGEAVLAGLGGGALGDDPGRAPSEARSDDEDEEDDEGEAQGESELAVVGDPAGHGLEGGVGSGVDGLIAEPAAEVLGEVLDRGVAVLGLEGGGLADDGGELAGDGLAGKVVDEGLELAADDLGGGLIGVAGRDGSLEGDELEEDEAEGELVARWPEGVVVTAGLLGGEVGGGPEDDPHRGVVAV